MALLENIEKIKRLEDVQNSYYLEMSSKIDALGLNDFEDENEYADTKLLISNLVYLIYERLHLRTARQVDYELIHEWATEKYKLADYLLQKQFPDFKIELFRKWIQLSIPIMSMNMYNRSNADTKDMFH